MSYPQSESIAQYFFILVRDWTGTRVALIDDWISLQTTETINDVGSFVLKLKANSPHIDFLILDYIIEMWRSVPGCGLDWYCEFRGLHRKKDSMLSKDGDEVYISSGTCLNGLLSRRVIAYKGGTIRAEKDAPSETVIKEYVYENCGEGSTLGNGRILHGVIPNFYVEVDTAGGIDWSGTREFENLLDVIKEISDISGIDFAVRYEGTPDDPRFIFRTFLEGIGQDRTRTGLDPSTGLNGNGNSPVILSVPLGTISDLEVTDDHSQEITAVVVPGQGDGSTRTVIYRRNTTAEDASPYNSVETTRSGDQEFIYQLNQVGDEALKELKAVIMYKFSPMQQASKLYGKHYTKGDIITLNNQGQDINQKLWSVSFDISQPLITITTEFRSP